MPYSITTKDGITISGIPDDLPHDDPSLKQRVASIRAQGGQSAPQAAAPASAATPAAPPVTAPTNGYLMGLRDPIDAGAQMLEHILPDSVSSAINGANNWLADKTGLVSKVAEGPQGTSKMVQAVNKAYDEGRSQRAQGLSNLVTGEKAEPGFDWGRLAGNVVNPVNLVPGGARLSAARTLPALAVAGARAGVISAAEQPVLNDNDGADFWTKKVEQAGLGALTGGLVTPAMSKVAGAAATGAKSLTSAVQSRIAPAQVTADTVRQAVSDTLGAHGMRLEDAPEVILQSVRRQAEEALRAGQRLDPVAAMRKAQFEAVGLTGEAAPTLGQVTRDPMQYANERNLVGVHMGGGVSNPISDRFQAQAQRMQHVFDNAGALGATDQHAAGATIMGGLRAADQPVNEAVGAAYNTARAMNNGRAAELERGTFSQAANQALDSEMLGHALPADVRSLLNDITSGKTPFNVDAATQIDTLLSRAQRRVQSGQQPDLSAAMAIGKIREALHATPLVNEAQAAARAATGGVEDAVMAGGPRLPGAPQLGGPAVDRSLPVPSAGNQVGQVLPGAGAAAPGMADTGANARAAFDQARRAARDRFATIEATPALKAALDESAPDKFVQQFILNAPARDVASMRAVLQNSPEALQQARAQIADHLKRAAFGNNASGDGGFAAERYLNTLRNLGREKLSVFFSPDELVQFNLAGKVMSDIGSIPAGARGAVNHSGTAGALMNLFLKFTSNTPVVRAIANQVGEIQTGRAMNKALSAQAVAANPGAQLSPQATRAISLLFAPAAVGGGALAGQAAN